MSNINKDLPEEMVNELAGGTFHIRCLSSVPVDLEELLAEIEAEEKQNPQ